MAIEIKVLRICIIVFKTASHFGPWNNHADGNIKELSGPLNL